jgi:hypothetical protein
VPVILLPPFCKVRFLYTQFLTGFAMFVNRFTNIRMFVMNALPMSGEWLGVDG